MGVQAKGKRSALLMPVAGSKSAGSGTRRCQLRRRGVESPLLTGLGCEPPRPALVRERTGTRNRARGWLCL